jgi:hypothetical protein
MGVVSLLNDTKSIQNDESVTPVWCVEASIVEDRIYGPNGSWSRKGTKHFAPNARVYIIDAYWGMGGETVTVVGRHRSSHFYVKMDIPTK